MATARFTEVEAPAADGSTHTVRITNPDKVYFPARGETKLDLAQYYLAVGEGALRGVFERPTVLKRYPDGATAEPFFQKRVPESRPEWIETVRVTFPSGRHADELCPVDVAHVVWAANLGCLDLNPWTVRREDVDHPDELRVDLDPQPGVPFDAVREVAGVVRDVLSELGYVSYPKTSGSRGIHINVRIEARWDFLECRRAALALARAVEQRVPTIATSKWWKEERGERVFIDYNQNARDRTVASAYSVRANPEGRVSTPIEWDELAAVDPADLTIATVPARFAERGDPSAAIDDTEFSLDPLLDLAAKDEAEGRGDEPWPPHFPKQRGEPKRVQPSKAKKATKPKKASPS
jgi:DNA ligase D